MNFFKRYAAYMQNNPQGYWFKNKAYGWGWVPATWQGWALLAVFIVVFIKFFVPFVHGPEPTNEEVLYFLLKVVAWALALIVACYTTGEPPKWQWGIPEKNESQ